MGALGLLAKRELRKRPGQAIAIFWLALAAGMLANAGLLLSIDYPHNVAAKQAAWEAPDAVAVLGHLPGWESVVEAVRADADVRRVETQPGMLAKTTLAYGKTDYTSAAFLFDVDAPVQLGRRTVTSSTPTAVSHPVWAPAALAASGTYRLGDEITLRTSTGSVTFHIQAFFEDAYTGTLGFGLLGFGLPTSDFEAFGAADFSPVTMIKVDADGADAASTAIGRAMKQSSFPVSVPWTLNAALLTQGAAVSAGIFSSILIVFAIIIVAVAVVIMRFLLRTAIVNDMTTIGVLRACGHTTGGIIAAKVGTLAAITAIGSAAGVGLSYLALPFAARTLTAQSGVTWEVAFAPGILAGVVAGMTAFVATLAVLATAGLRRVPTVVALRDGTATHAFRATPLPLATTRVPLAPALGIKSALRHWRQSLVLALTVTVATFAVVFSLGMTSTLLGSPEASIRLLVGELEDVDVTVAAGVDARQLASELVSVPGVTTAFVSSVRGISDDDVDVAAIVTDDPSVWRDNPIYEGRLPRHDNEVALAAPLAERLHLGVGDTWLGGLGAGRASYLVTGLATGARNMGRFLVMTTAGYERLDPTFRFETVAVYVASDAPAVIASITSRFGADVVEVTDARKSVLVELSSYLAALPPLAAVIGGFTSGLVVLGVTLVVGTLITQGRRQFGIQKALGFTHPEIARQVRWTSVPAVTVGAILGAALGAVGLAPLMVALLRGVGIMKVDVAPQLIHVVGIPAGVVVLAWVVTWVVARRLRRVSAYSLVTE